MLSKKTILITGAGKGIGKAIVSVCLNAGATVIANVRSEDARRTLSDSLTDPQNLHFSHYDVTDTSAVKQAFQGMQKEFGTLDGLVNNAGIMLDAPIGMTALSQVDDLLAVNTKSVFQHTQLASRLMMRNKCGSIVNVNSQTSVQGSAGQSAYAMSKAAISGLTRSCAKELGSFNIRCNEVAPGFIETDLTDHYDEIRREDIVKNSALPKLGKAEDVAKLVCFLLSEDAGFITGQTIGVDGGLKL